MRLMTTVVLLVALIMISSQASDARQPAGLHVLLTNDDGYQASGLRVMREALAAAGHRVTVVAPAENQSGAGTRATTSRFRVEQKAEGVWAVEGSPLDAAWVGLQIVLRNAPPDLVVSGINQGANPGSSLASGTVGAALAAAVRGYPAIAVSAQIRPDEASAQPVRYPIMERAYPGAAQIVLGLMRKLCTPGCPPAMKEGTVLNVNHPVGDLAQAKGILFIQPGGDWDVIFEQVSPTELQGRLVVPTCVPGSLKTDVTAVACGYVAITALNASRRVDAPVWQRLERSLKGFDPRVR